MIGICTGSYEFDDTKIRVKTSFDKIYFTMTIHSFDGNSFTGIVKDDIGNIRDGFGIIGNIISNRINFKKCKTIQSGLNNNAPLKLEHKTGPFIYYSGILTDENMKSSGDWKYELTFGFLFGSIPFPCRRSKGTWSMKYSKEK